jgi:hypothetical protein
MSRHLFPEEIWLERIVEQHQERFEIRDYTILGGERYIIAPEYDRRDWVAEKKAEVDEAFDEAWEAIKQKIPGLMVDEDATDDAEQTKLEEQLDESWEELKAKALEVLR